MRAYNRKRKPRNMTKLSVLKDGIKCTYKKKLSFVNNETLNIYHELVSYWKHKTGWIMETTVFYFPKEYRKRKELKYKEKFPKYIGVRTFYYDGCNSTKHISFKKY